MSVDYSGRLYVEPRGRLSQVIVEHIECSKEFTISVPPVVDSRPVLCQNCTEVITRTINGKVENTDKIEILTTQVNG